MANPSRRDLLKLASLASIGAGVARPQSSLKSMADVHFKPKSTVRIGVIGTGGRGGSLIDNFAAVEGVQITALCDTVKDKVLQQQARLDKAGKAGHPIALFLS